MTRGTGDLLPWSWARERLSAERSYRITPVTSHDRRAWTRRRSAGTANPPYRGSIPRVASN